MSYLNQVIRRQAPLTKCQCAVLAILSNKYNDVDTIWKRNPVYCRNTHGRVENVKYGTIGAVLKSLVQQGFVETTGGKNPLYRTSRP